MLIDPGQTHQLFFCHELHEFARISVIIKIKLHEFYLPLADLWNI